MKFNHLLFIAISAVALGVIVGKTDLFEVKPVVFKSATVLPQARPLQEFSLFDHEGNVFTQEELKGKWSVLFFGFTHCPDVCPNTLQLLKSVKSSLSELEFSKDFRVIFVSVDPARDTPARLKEYLSYFDEEFVGLTGSDDEVSAFTKQLSMPYIVQKKDENGYYNVDHSASLVVMDKQGAMKAIISPPHKVSEIVDDLIVLGK